MTRPEPRSYRFGDASRPGVLLGLSAQQAVPLVAGVLWLAACLQTPLSAPGGLAGLVVSVVVAFGRWRGVALAEAAVPALGLGVARITRRQRWVRSVTPTAAATPLPEPLPAVLDGVELTELTCSDVVTGGPSMVAVAHDKTAGTVSASLRVSAQGFSLAGALDQDTMLGQWGAALAPFARERSPVSRIIWQEWARRGGSDNHRDFLSTTGALERTDEPTTADYLALVEEQARLTMTREVLVTVTVELARVRARGAGRSRAEIAVTQLLEEIKLFTARLGTAGVEVQGHLTLAELAEAIRERSDPACTAQVTALHRSLASASRRVGAEWGPMVVEPAWRFVRVDGAFHRVYRMATWPQLPVPADWLGSLVTEPDLTRTVVIVMEPVPLSRSARTADREAMAREADAEAKGRRGFRVNAKERRRLAEVEARERELAQGHPEFRYVGLVGVCASSEAELDDAAAVVEQAAAQSMLDLRPLDARHGVAWVACLPLGRTVAGGRGSGR